jgi:hypothetical protein
VAGTKGRYSIQVIVAIQHQNRSEAVAELRRRLAEWLMETIDARRGSPLAGSLLHYAVLAPRRNGNQCKGKSRDRADDTRL